jgi:hypothetical protein
LRFAGTSAVGLITLATAFYGVRPPGASPSPPADRIVARVFVASTLIGGMSWTFLAITLF